MRITFLTTQPSYWGGSEVLWIQIAELAIQEGHDVQVIVYDQKNGLHPTLKALSKKASSFSTMKNFNFQSSFFEKAKSAVINKIIKPNLDVITKFAPDCIVISQANNFDAAFHPVIGPFLLQFNKPFHLISQFNVEHGVLSFPDIQKASAIFGKAAKIFFVSKRNKEVSERQLAQNITNAFFIDNPLNLKDFSYVPYPQGTIINFASVARFDVGYKGQDILFQILSADKWKKREWRLNIFGSGTDGDYLKKLAVFYQIDGKVIFQGQVSDVKDIWANNHALLMPSIAEGKPLALEEAMVCGRIGVVSDVAGNGELVDDGENGYLASSFFPKPFAESLEKAWEERLTWEDKGRLAHEKMLKTLDFSPAKTVLYSVVNG